MLGMVLRVSILLLGQLVMLGDLVAEKPAVAHIDYIEPASSQLAETAASVIWADDFDAESWKEAYAEKGGDLTNQVRLGRKGKALHMRYPKGHRGKGGCKVFFGDSPAYPAKALRSGRTFDDIYWRFYVKHQAGWQGGGPAKLSRATSIAGPRWSQAMIAHVWSSGESLTLDPASGIKDDQLVTTRYNDFANLRWMGNKPVSKFKIHATSESGRWVCVEARAKLNTPGKKDGENQLWIDGKLEAERVNLDWRGRFDRKGINAVFLEAYWNDGSPVDQSRWIDHFVIATEPIGPITAAVNPVIVKTPYSGPGKQQAWQVELAKGASGRETVWKSPAIEHSSQFTIPSEILDSGTLYYVRVRQQSSEGAVWSDWSDWHQPFRTME